MEQKVKCNQCGWKGLNSATLKGINPFDNEEPIYGCPKCRGINSTDAACDEEGCWSLVVCGTSTTEGYRNTCATHMPASKFKEE